MKKISKEIISYETWYEAGDGRQFKLQEECEKYEQSAYVVLESEYRKLVINEGVEEDLFSFGNCEAAIEVIRFKSKDDVELAKRMYCLINKCKPGDDNGWRCNFFNAADKAFEDNDVLVVGRGYSNEECFCLVGTKNQIIENVIAFCCKDKKSDEKE